jgi:hypothetical protein
MRLGFAVVLIMACALSGADKKPPATSSASNKNVEIRATAYLEKQDVKDAVGAEMPPYIVAVEVTVRPKGGQPLKIFADDFLLHCYSDGQKSGPFAPTQIAGKGGLTLVSRENSAGTFMGNQNGPVWGGIGGGRPQRLPGNDTGVGNATATTTSTEAQETDAKKEKDNPLLTILKQKAMVEGESSEPVKGLLYFPLEGKKKAKDLAIQYNGMGGKLILEFKQ